MTNLAYDAAWFWHLPPSEVLSMPLDVLVEHLDQFRRIDKVLYGG